MEKETLPDATVVAASKQYTWVVIDRDHTPELAKEFNVSAYPSFIVINPKKEEIYRFQSYKKPEAFLADLNEGHRRFALYKSGKVWDEPTPRPEKITDAFAYTTRKAPSEKVSAGIAFLNGDAWIGTMFDLFQVDIATNSIKRSFKMKEIITDVATDGKVLYLLEGGWTAGKPIHVMDPVTGENIRDIVTAANAKSKSYGAKGIAYVAGKLYVLDGAYGKIVELDLQTGDVTREIKSKERYISGLSFDGENFVSGSRTDLLLINPQSGEVVRKVKMNYPLRSVEYYDGAYYVMEQPIFGYTKDHKWVQVWPREALIYRFEMPAVAAVPAMPQ